MDLKLAVVRDKTNKQTRKKKQKTYKKKSPNKTTAMVCSGTRRQR